MKRMLSLQAVVLIVLATAVQSYSDVARRPSPTPAQGKVVFHTGLTVQPDANAYEARLQISQETLARLREAAAGQSASAPPDRKRTIIAGIFLFLSVSFAGVYLMRSKQRRGQKAAAAAMLVAGVLGAATVISQANAGPPGYVRWNNLPQALSDGRSVSGGLDIEVVPGEDNMKLIVPLRKPKKPGDED